MSDYQNEYQKFADSAVRSRAREEGYGRLRFALFWGVVGPLGIFLTRVLHFEPTRWMAIGLVATAPLAVLLLIVNYIRLPNDEKTSSQALLIGFGTLVGAGATVALAHVFELLKAVSP
jgi:hypothetical protein